jgi:ATP-dependent Clp protease protease subunit
MLLEKSPKNRYVILSGTIDDSKAGTIIDAIQEINWDDALKEQEFTGFERKPIRLVINSPGGSVYSGLAIVGVVEMSRTPVYTVCVGAAMSMALFVFLAGKKRLAHRNSTFLYHEITCFVWDKLEAIRQDLKEGERLQAMLDGMLLGKTSVLREQIDAAKAAKWDWYIPAEEALKLGIVHEIVDGPEGVW